MDSKDLYETATNDMVKLLKAPEFQSQLSHKALLQAITYLGAAYAFSSLDEDEEAE